MIDVIRLAGTPAKALLTNDNLSYLRKLEQNKIDPNYFLNKKKENGGRKMANPEGNYFHDVDLGLTYTYSTIGYFSAGFTVTYETRNSNTDPVMYLFQKGTSEPITNSWSNDDSNGHESSLSCTIPVDGLYELMVRAYNSSSPGVSDIYQNGALFASQVPVAGQLFQYSAKNSVVNTFTSFTFKIPYVASDTKLYIAPNYSGVAPFRNYNDDYYQSGGGNFNWSLDSRIKWNFGAGMQINALVTAYSMNSAGVYDFYGNCEFSNIASSFPNLKPDDAIQTAPVSSNYNCGSWAGGITSFWWWPNAWSDWSVAGNYLQSFDNFYGNNPPRYAGAYTYTRTNADESNATLALWYNNNTGYTHVSVCKPGNDNLHGYSWESKPGQLMRTMHPRDGLQDGSYQGYGSISNYYRYTGLNARIAGSGKPKNLEESISLGMSKLDSENFDDRDRVALSKFKEQLDESEVNQFAQYFKKWQYTWRDLSILKASNPRIYSSSEEYKDLHAFCKKLDIKGLPLIVEYFIKYDVPVSVLIEDILLPGNEDLMKAVKVENAEKLYDENSVYIVRSNTVNCIKFLKKLIAKPSKVENVDPVRIEQNHPNTFTSTTKFRFYLPKSSTVTIELYSSQGGQFVTLIAEDIAYDPGWQIFSWTNKPSLVQAGTYFYRVIVNGKVAGTKRLIIK